MNHILIALILLAGWVSHACMGNHINNSGQLRKPQTIKTWAVTDFGAIANDTLSDTKAFQDAINEAVKKGGGTIVIPGGTFITGTVTLQNHIRLELDKKAIWIGSRHLTDYPVLNPSRHSYHSRFVFRSLIYADGLNEIEISGKGIIDGMGGSPDFKGQPGQKPPLSRPRVFLFVASKGITINGVSLRNSGYWMQHYLDCENVSISNLSVYNHCNRNNDGLDIDGCRNVIIRNCTIDADDDALCFKATGPYNNEDITVKNCILRSNCNAIKMGTETTGNFRNIKISGNVVERSDTASEIYKRQSGLAGIALEIVDGGLMENIEINNTSLSGIETPLFIRLGNRARQYKEDGPKPGIGTLRNIKINGISATDTRPISSSITGISGHYIENVSVSNCTFTLTGGGIEEDVQKTVPEMDNQYPESKMFGKLPAYGLFVRHVKGLSVKNLTFVLKAQDERPALFMDDVENSSFDNLAMGNGSKNDDLILNNCYNLQFTRLSRNGGKVISVKSDACQEIKTERKVIVRGE